MQKQMQNKLIAIITLMLLVGILTTGRTQTVTAYRLTDGAFDLSQRLVGIEWTVDVLPPNSVWRFRYQRPDGTIAADYTSNLGNTYTYYGTIWFYLWSVSLDQPGTWHLLLDINSTTRVNAPFAVGEIPVAQKLYAIRDLGTVGGDTDGWKINASGQVAGYSASIQGGIHAWRHTPYVGIEDFFYINGFPDNYAVAINRSGQMAGYASNGGADHAFVAINGLTDIGMLPNYPAASDAFGINDVGQVVGTSINYASQGHAFLYTDGKMTDLGTLGGGDSIAVGINSSGQVVGTAATVDIPGTYLFNDHAFLWTPSSPNGTTGTMRDLDTLGGEYSFANAINDKGQVVGHYGLPLATLGFSFDRTGSTLPVYHAFSSNGGAMTDIGTLGGNKSVAYDVNVKGEIVGWSESAPYAGDRRAFLDNEGKMIDLNTLISDAAWTLLEARGINDAGQISGVGLNNGQRRAFILTPVRYDIQDLGTLGGSYSYGYGINAWQQVAGGSYTQGNVATHAFLYSDGSSLQDIGTLGGTQSEAFDINDGGQVVGYAFTQNNAASHAFLWSNGVFQDLGTLGGISSSGMGVNNQGDVVGWSYVPDNSTWHPIISKQSVMTDLGTLGGPWGYAWAVNNSGQVAGYSALPGNPYYHAFLYSNSHITDLGTLGGNNSWVTLRAINSTGDIAGTAETGDIGPDGQPIFHAFRWRSGQGMDDLGTLGGWRSRGYTMNAAGKITGTSDVPSGYSPQATLDDESGMISLNAWCDPSLGWQLSYAYSINDADDIAGQGDHVTLPRAYRMRPYPLLSAVNTSSLSATSAVISWNTALASSSKVEFGPTLSYGSSNTGAGGVSHSVSLPELMPGTLYHYRVTSTDSYGRTATSGDGTFVTYLSNTPGLQVTVILSRVGPELLAGITVTNTGTGDALSTQITTTSLGGVGASDSLPLSLGAIAAGKSQQATLHFPGTIGASGTRTVLKVNGAYQIRSGVSLKGATFGSTLRVALP
jgi:probable HAF family extracellular repeat protein